jgi:plastocyanin
MRRFIFSILVFAALRTTGVAAQISGVVKVTGLGGRSPVVTVIYAEPLDQPTPAKPGRFKLTQQNKSFNPRVLAVPVGSTVDFPNLDPIFHNAFSLSRPASFDLGLYRAGASKSRVFTEPAIYRLFCNIHPQMTAVILVLPTPYITERDGAGTFRLDLPAGRYRISAWSERAQAASAEVTVGDGPASVPELTLDESKYVELAHKNKFGQEYPKSAYDPTKDSVPH